MIKLTDNEQPEQEFWNMIANTRASVKYVIKIAEKTSVADTVKKNPEAIDTVTSLIRLHMQHRKNLKKIKDQDIYLDVKKRSDSTVEGLRRLKHDLIQQLARARKIYGLEE